VVAPTSSHPLLLDRAQQLHLHRQRQIGNLVEEQRAPVGRLEEAVAVLLGAGERALAVAEELRLHQVFRNRAAVDGDEGLRGPPAGLVHQPRGQLLAADPDSPKMATGAMLRASRAIEARTSAIATDRPSSSPAGGSRRRRRHLRHRARDLDMGGRADQAAQGVEPHRLGEIVEGTGLECGDGVLGTAMGGQHRDRRVRGRLR
jgi:hypothetical protein